MVVWWRTAPRDEREAVLAIPAMRERFGDEDRAAVLAAATLPHAVHEALLETLFASGSNLLILPIQDVFGWADRINQPATVGDGNWRWRLPWPSDGLSSEPQALAAANQLREWSSKHGR
jgi:4-alpha-glucanotransferase